MTFEPQEPAAVLADLDAERVLLGALLHDNAVIGWADIAPDHLYDETHAAIWKTAVEVIEKHGSVSVAILAAHFPGQQVYIAGLPRANSCAAAKDAAHIVRDFAARRNMVETIDGLRERIGDMSLSPDELGAEAIAKISSVGTGRRAKSVRQVAKEILEDLKKPLEVYPTGISRLDASMGGGLVAGKLYGFGARMKIGKTLLSGTISYNLAENNVPHLYVALEMSDREIEHRNIARRMGFNSIKFVTRDLQGLENRVADYIVNVNDCLYYEHAPGATLNELRAIIGRNRSLGIRGVIVDYLQLVQGKSPKETEESHLRRVSQWLADMARQTGLWVITACQLNQDENVRGGEGLKLAADQYYVIHREKLENKEAEWSDYAWLTLEQTRYTLYQHVGSQSDPALWLHKRGPFFSESPPSYYQGNAA